MDILPEQNLLASKTPMKTPRHRFRMMLKRKAPQGGFFTPDSPRLHPECTAAIQKFSEPRQPSAVAGNQIMEASKVHNDVQQFLSHG